MIKVATMHPAQAQKTTVFDARYCSQRLLKLCFSMTSFLPPKFGYREAPPFESRAP
jgi:hypothetical protein